MVLILSGYDDFAYAQEAISIGVSQYLLKPLTKSQLIDVLIKIKEKKDKDTEEEEYKLQFLKEAQEYLNSSRRDFFDELVTGNLSVSEILEKGQKLNLDLVSERYNLILFLLEEEIFSDKYSRELAEVEEGVSLLSVENENIIIFGVGVGVYAILIKGNEKNIDYNTNICVDSLHEICKPLKDKIQWRVSIGTPIDRLSNISKCYSQTRKALFHIEKPLDKFEKHITIDFNPNDMDPSKTDSKLVENFLANGTSRDIKDFVDDYFNRFSDETMESVLFRHYIILNIKFAVNRFLDKLDIKSIETDNSQKFKEKLTFALRTLSGSKEYITELLNEAFYIRDNITYNKYQEMLKNVIDYMEENYTNPDIGLNEVASIANMTPTYFSAVFSQEMDKTFVEYLTELRMEKAKDLLLFSTETSSEIAFKIGYNDPNYFSFLFKKINGVSPREFRSGRR